MSEIQVRLPDGKLLAVPAGSTVLSVAERIGKGLARAALAGRIDGRLVDLRVPLHENVSLEIVTARDPAGGAVIRHSAEHVMADAVKRLFPTAQIDVGRTDHSEKFQYDFRVERPFTPEDLEQIEKEMAKIIAEKAIFTREVMSRSAAQAFFEAQGEALKVSRLADIPEGEEITVFRHGGFADLCRGPHVQRTDQIGAFALTESAGSYWRGDERNPMLQRIYGTAFATRKELDEHRARLEEARRRDHRRVGVELELYHLDPMAPGSPFYLPKGVAALQRPRRLRALAVSALRLREVISPQLFRTELFKTSGHYQLFREDMFLMEGDEGEELALKPMNCPGHCHLFESRKRSYRELPLRLAEFTRLHRNERSGTLTGLSRVRAFAQDDAHVFCEEEQVDIELDRFFEMTREVYSALGLDGRRGGGLDAPREVERRGRGLGGRGAAAGRGRRARRLRLRDQARRARPSTAPRSSATFATCSPGPGPSRRLQIDVAMPGRFGLRYIGRDGAAAPAGDAAPRRARLARALHRALRREDGRRLPALARAGAGAGAPDRRAAPRIRPPRARDAVARRRALRARRTQRHARLQDPRSRAAQDPRDAGGRGSGGSRGQRDPALPTPAGSGERSDGAGCAGRRAAPRHP